MSEKTDQGLVHLSSGWFIAICAAISAAIIASGSRHAFTPVVIAAEVFATVLGLFVFGSYRYRIDKNALTYGSALIVASTFFTGWWPTSGLRASMAAEGLSALARFVHHHFLTFHGLEDLFHLDTMLFILGLTLFVAVISQTRILESLSFGILRKRRGALFTTMAIITSLVAFSSAILGGVSMIGLLIRVMVILLFLSKVTDADVIFFVVMATMITTICGMWISYGEPPNLIMAANLRPHLNDSFFLRYCLPIAVASYFVLWFNMRRRIGGRTVEMAGIDYLEMNTADVRFLQVVRHGEVLTDLEFVENHRDELRGWHDAVLKRLHRGSGLGTALVEENVPAETRRAILASFLAPEVAENADAYFAARVTGNAEAERRAAAGLEASLLPLRKLRKRSQRVAVVSFVPFFALLILHAFNKNVPLFVASFAAFATAFVAIARYANMRKAAFQESRTEYEEYLFLFPLFLSISLLTKTGIFAQLTDLLHLGVERLGEISVALIQFTGATLLSGILDNNVVADFASRPLHGLPVDQIHFFSMAQIAGYGLGGCLTHIGSAQSVVAYSFIRKDVRSSFTPLEWVKVATWPIVQIFAVAAVLIVAEGLIAKAVFSGQ